MRVTVDKDGTIPLEAFAELVDISKVAFYKFKVLKDKTISLKFYYKKKKLIKTRESK